MAKNVWTAWLTLLRRLCGYRRQLVASAVLLSASLWWYQLAHLLFGWDSSLIHYRFLAKPLPNAAKPGMKKCFTQSFEFDFPPQAPRTWEELGQMQCIYLNLGADSDKNGNPKRPYYDNYVGVQPPPGHGGWGSKMVDGRCACGGWCLCQDLRSGIPLPNNTVSRIHSEDFIEHLEQKHYPFLFEEIYRVLKPGGLARLSMPDYSHPRQSERLRAGFDRNAPQHLTLTNFALMQTYIARSPFRSAQWLMFWDNSPLEAQNPFLPPGARATSVALPMKLVQRPINFSLGLIKRSPEVDWRNHILNPTGVTSLVFDLTKDIEPKS